MKQLAAFPNAGCRQGQQNSWGIPAQTRSGCVSSHCSRAHTTQQHHCCCLCSASRWRRGRLGGHLSGHRKAASVAIMVEQRNMMSLPFARPPRARGPRRTARQGLACATAAAAAVLVMLLRATHLLGGAAKQGGERAASGGGGSGPGKPLEEDWGHPLFSRIDKELERFKDNITLQARSSSSVCHSRTEACMSAGCMSASQHSSSISPALGLSISADAALCLSPSPPHRWWSRRTARAAEGASVGRQAGR